MTDGTAAPDAYDSLPDGVTALFGADATAERAYDLLTVDVPAASWLTALETARSALGCGYFDWLSAVDEPGTGFRVAAHVVSVAPGSVRRLLVRTTVPHEAPELPTALGIYAGAGWHERETHEMFGVTFTDHPNLVPLLLPENFEGHPLRKDFVLAARVAKAWPGAKEPGSPRRGTRAPSAARCCRRASRTRTSGARSRASSRRRRPVPRAPPGSARPVRRVPPVTARPGPRARRAPRASARRAATAACRTAPRPSSPRPPPLPRPTPRGTTPAPPSTPRIRHRSLIRSPGGRPGPTRCRVPPGRRTVRRATSRIRRPTPPPTLASGATPGTAPDALPEANSGPEPDAGPAASGLAPGAAPDARPGSGTGRTPDATPGSGGPTPDAGSEPGSGSGTAPGSGPEPGPVAGDGSEPGTVSGPSPANKPGAETGSAPRTDGGAVPGTESGPATAPGEAPSGTDVGPEADRESGTGPDAAPTRERAPGREPAADERPAPDADPRPRTDGPGADDDDDRPGGDA